MAGDAIPPARRLSPLGRSLRGALAKRPDFRRPPSMMVEGPSASTLFHGGDTGFLRGALSGVVSRMRRRLAGRSPSPASALDVVVSWSPCSREPGNPFSFAWSACGGEVVDVSSISVVWRCFFCPGWTSDAGFAGSRSESKSESNAISPRSDSGESLSRSSGPARPTCGAVGRGDADGVILAGAQGREVGSRSRRMWHLVR